MKKELSLFTTAGYPHIDSLPAHLELFENKGVDFVEVGIPFSDPLADGPTIQDASTVALKNGMHLGLLFEQLKTRKSKIPIVLMGYINPVLQFGLDKFLQNAVEVGASGFVLPDLSVELYEERYQSEFEEYGIPVCFLVTPSTSNERVKKAAQLSRNGFVYLVSSNSTTGKESNETTDLQARYKEIKNLCGATKVMIGFGIKDKDSFSTKAKNVDGGIIGSAFIKAAGEGKAEEFCESLCSAQAKSDPKMVRM